MSFEVPIGSSTAVNTLNGIPLSCIIIRSPLTTLLDLELPTIYFEPLEPVEYILKLEFTIL